MQNDQVIRRELAAGEQLLWSGMPAQGLRVRASDAFMIPFSLLWGGFVFFWEFTVVSQKGAPVFMTLWGIPFVLVGCYMIFGRFLHDRALRARTWYGLTDQRALIVTGLFGRQVKSLDLASMGDITLREHANGNGDIVFGAGPSMQMAWSGTSGRRLAPSFEMLTSVRRVYALIRDAQNALRSR